MARVFDAFDERLERPVAVKILRSETLAVPGMRQRFQQEALIAARLIHPHIVAVLDFGENEPSSYLVMERLPGSTLRDEIIARGPLPTQRVMLVLGETLTALAAAHKFGVLHRDIKPSNILLQQDGHTKITDFGIAKSFDTRTDPDRLRDDMTMTGFVLGTPGYLAPERRAGSPATVQSDLYSVGAVMMETLTGLRPGPGGAPTEGLPPPLRDVACRALAPDPQDRFMSASEMLRTLRLSATQTNAGARPTRPQSPATVTAPVRAAIPPPGDAGFTAPASNDTPPATPSRPDVAGLSSAPSACWPSSRRSSCCSSRSASRRACGVRLEDHVARPRVTARSNRRRGIGHQDAGDVDRQWRTARRRGTGRARSRRRPRNRRARIASPRRSRCSPSPRCCSTGAASHRGNSRTW